MMQKKDPTVEQLSDSGKWKGKRMNFFSNRVIVRFKVPSQDLDRALHSMCDSVCKSIPDGALRRMAKHGGRALFTFNRDEDVVDIAKSLSKRNDVEYAEPDVIDSAAVVPNDARFGDQWGLSKIGAPQAWDIEQGSADNILIGIIDSGISMSTLGQLDHPDLNNNSRYILGTDFVDGGTPRDLNSHGTHVAGIAGSETNNSSGVAGMNWKTPLYICRTLDAAGNGSSADFADAVEEIVDYAVANGLKAVINYSGGGGENQTKRNACKYADDNGMVLCAATGNDTGGPVIFPAAYSPDFGGVVAVGSSDVDDTVSTFSNIGPEVTVVAPGSGILSTTPTYLVDPNVALNFDFFNGTSMATPLVSGLAALVWSRNPSLTNQQVRHILMDTAKPLGADDFSNDWGHGRIDALKAVSSVASDGPSSGAKEFMELARSWENLPEHIRQAIGLLIQEA